MTIDRDKLVELLVEKTGFSKEQVEGQLSELVSRIQGAAGEGKSFEIEGFGTFGMSGGELSFEPADELRTEINNDYAGMEPIELIGANKEEPAPEPADRRDEADEEEDPFPGLDDIEAEEETGQAPFDLDDDSAFEEGPPPAAAEPDPTAEEELDDMDAELDEILGLGRSPKKSESVLGEELSKVRTEKSGEGDQKAEETEPAAEAPDISEVGNENEKEEVPFSGLENEDEEGEPEMGKTPAAGEPRSDTAPFDIEEEPVAEEEPPRKTKWEPAPELKGAKKIPAKKEERDTIGTVLVVAMIVIVIAVGGWFVYDMGLLSGMPGSDTGGLPQQQMAQQAPPPVQQQPEGGTAVDQQEAQVAETVPSQEEPGNQTEVPVSEPSAGNEVAEGESSQPPAGVETYGLMGTANPNANNGYTIVVHSMRSRVVAEAIESTLADDGYRTLLMGTVVNGNQYWRIGIGQFETVSSAQAAAGNLIEPYRSENFIRRIAN